MLAALFSWWTEQMRALAAPLTRRTAGRPKDALLLHRDLGEASGGEASGGEDGDWHIVRRRNGMTTPLATLPADATDGAWRRAFAQRRRGEAVIVTSDHPFLVRRTTLPIAAAANLGRLLRYEMDRLTPFAASDVLFSHRILSRDIAGGTLLADVAVVPRVWVRDALERLAALSIRPDALEPRTSPSPVDFPPPDAWPGDARGRPGATPPDHELRRISLGDTDPVRRARVRLAWRVGTGACLALAAAVCVVPFIQQSLALARVE